MNVPSNEQVLEAIEAFLLRHQMPATKLGMEATRDPNVVGDLRQGKRSPRLKLLQRLSAFMKAKDAELLAGDDAAPVHSDSDTALEAALS